MELLARRRVEIPGSVALLITRHYPPVGLALAAALV
jgi:hypothetical protein